LGGGEWVGLVSRRWGGEAPREGGSERGSTESEEKTQRSTRSVDLEDGNEK